jgi:hypothetical protein
MSLTTALLILAAAIVAALLLQGWWATRRARPRQVAEGDARVEPALGDGAAEGAAGTAAADDAAADAAAGGDAALRPPRLRSAPRPSGPLDPLIDALAPLVLEAPISGEAVLAHLPVVRRAGAKPWAVEGLDADTGTWEPPQPGRRYSEVQAGVQLANRSGPLNEIEYSEFVQQLQVLADGLGARPDLPDMLEVVARARELDAQTAPLDAQLTLTLRANGAAWSVPYVQQAAQRAGFVTGPVTGRYVLPAADDGAPPLLTLAVQSQAAIEALDPDASASTLAGAVRECLLGLDLAQSAESAEPYPAWHRTATQLAQELDATAVDDRGQPLSLHAFSAIGREVEEVYRRLQALDLPAGSSAARRLFS